MPSPTKVLPTSLETLSGLDARETQFVVAYVMHAGERGAGATAALWAGYSAGNRNGAHSMASKLLRRPAILKAIKEEIGRKLTSAAALGVSTLEALARGATSEQVRLSAARELVDRGYGVPMSRNASIVATASVEDLLRQLDAGALDARDEDTADDIIDVTPMHRGAPLRDVEAGQTPEDDDNDD